MPPPQRIEQEYRDETCSVGEARFGKGLFAERRIGESGVVFEFPFTNRKVMTFEEAVALGEWSAYPLQIDTHTYLELQSPQMYLNHSCDPNTGVVQRGDRFFLVAIRDIQPGDEITFDYSTDTQEDYFSMPCGCGAPNCRKIIADFSDLPKEVQQHYLDLGVVPDFIAKQYL